jgi:hypothetical protein
MQSRRSACTAVTVKGGAEMVDHMSFVTDFVRKTSIFDFSTCLREAMLMIDQKRRAELS